MQPYAKSGLLCNMSSAGPAVRWAVAARTLRRPAAAIPMHSYSILQELSASRFDSERDAMRLTEILYLRMKKK